MPRIQVQALLQVRGRTLVDLAIISPWPHNGGTFLIIFMYMKYVHTLSYICLYVNIYILCYMYINNYEFKVEKISYICFKTPIYNI